MLTPKDQLRFWSKVQIIGECWMWMASRHKFGYGWFELNSKCRTAHTIAYEEYYGPIPSGLFVLHSCDNPPCVRPSHLFLGTQAENLADMKSKGRHARGITHGHAALTDQDISEIRTLANTGLYQREIGNIYGVHQVTISKIVLGKLWSHVP